MNFLESYDRRVENDLLASSDLLETQQILLHICCGSYIFNSPEKESTAVQVKTQISGPCSYSHPFSSLLSLKTSIFKV